MQLRVVIYYYQFYLLAKSSNRSPQNTGGKHGTSSKMCQWNIFLTPPHQRTLEIILKPGNVQTKVGFSDFYNYFLIIRRIMRNSGNAIPCKYDFSLFAAKNVC